MKRTVSVFWMIIPIILLFSGLIYAVDYSKTSPARENKNFTGGEPFPNVPYSPSNSDVLTDTQMVGETQYDYQTNGSTGHRVAVDSYGGVHFGWMNGLSYPTTRQIYCNFVDENDVWLGATQAGSVNLEGYVQLAIAPDNRMALTYHRSGPNTVWLAVDSNRGYGIFNYYQVPNLFGSAPCMWPYMTIDRSGRFQIVMTESSAAGAPQRIGYIRTIDTLFHWSQLACVDTVSVISPVIVSSPVSDKVAIVYCHPTDLATQWQNDVYYIQSLDGTTWDWARGKINITNYGQDDSLFAYTDIAAVYDNSDNLNIYWSAQYVTDAGVYYQTFLNHYDVTSGTISVIQAYPDSVWPQSGCDFGVWNRPISKMSAGVHQPSNALFVAYTKFDSTDCSAGGYANGDICMTYSVDGGTSWAEEINMTGSSTPGCQPGDCDSEHWSTIAEKVDNNIHLIYIEDKDAGGIPQTEGAVTDNPVKYISYRNPLTGIENDISVPKSFSLKQNYPNPFNAQTSIEFTLDKKSGVELAVYNLLGAKVTTLANGQMEAGKHSINFDASEISSGIYFYTLKTDDSAVTKKMTLLK